MRSSAAAAPAISTYIDNTNTPTTVTLTFSLDDNGNTGSGGAQTSPTETATIDVTPCYCPGTLIKTARGEKRVEKLKIGDEVMTASGAARPIKWIGRRSYAGRFVMGRKDILPICIKAGALDENVPKRDLWISPHHAMYLEREGGVLIEAKDLVNGVSIVQAERVEKVEYFHVELDTHDVIIAEGALSETYLDDDNRLLFHNAQDYYARYREAAARAGTLLRAAPAKKAMRSRRRGSASPRAPACCATPTASASARCAAMSMR